MTFAARLLMLSSASGCGVLFWRGRPCIVLRFRRRAAGGFAFAFFSAFFAVFFFALASIFVGPCVPFIGTSPLPNEAAAMTPVCIKNSEDSAPPPPSHSTRVKLLKLCGAGCTLPSI